METASVGSLLQKTGMWRASSIDCEFRQGIPTGFPDLDARLAGSGWPADGITELLLDNEGIGEIRLLTPAMANLSQTQTRWIIWVSPPHLPYAPALTSAGIDLSNLLIISPKNAADTLWVLEKALASSSCSMVLAWPGNLQDKQIRRLQVASRDGNCLGILFRPSRVAKHSSPAELRLRLGSQFSALSDCSAIRLQVLKRRGGWRGDVFSIDFHDALNRRMPDFSDLRLTRSDRAEKPAEQSPIHPDQQLFDDEFKQEFKKGIKKDHAMERQ
jgi:cell division inhibitor SulA